MLTGVQDHLKERLTGAAILVVVVVLLVPELFHGRPSTETGVAAAAAGPPVRSVTIDLGDAGATRPLTENAPPAAPAALPGAAPATSTSAPTSAPPAREVTPAAPPAGPSVATPKSAAPAPSTHATSSAAAPAAARTQSAAASASPATHGGAVKSGWTVQVGSFARREFADRMVKDAASKGFTVEVAGPDDRGLYRVRSPPRADRASAMALKQKMQASGFKPIVNKTP
jgi:DedD protein